MNIIAQDIERARQADRLLTPAQFAQRERTRGEELARLLIEHVQALQMQGEDFAYEADGYRVAVSTSQVQVERVPGAAEPAADAPVQPTDQALEKTERYNASIAGAGAG